LALDNLTDVRGGANRAVFTVKKSLFVLRASLLFAKHPTQLADPAVFYRDATNRVGTNGAR